MPSRHVLQRRHNPGTLTRCSTYGMLQDIISFTLVLDHHQGLVHSHRTPASVLLCTCTVASLVPFVTHHRDVHKNRTRNYRSLPPNFYSRSPTFKHLERSRLQQYHICNLLVAPHDVIKLNDNPMRLRNR